MSILYWLLWIFWGLRVSVGIQMGLILGAWGVKFGCNLRPWWREGCKVAPRLQKEVIWSGSGVYLEVILDVCFCDFSQCLYSRWWYFQVMFLNKRVPVSFLYHVFLICFAFVSSHIMNATYVNPLFYSALLLSALPVPFLRQVYFFVFLNFFFRVWFCSFSGRCWKGLLAPVWFILDQFWGHLGAIFVTFWG